MTRYSFMCNRELADALISGNRMYDLRPARHPYKVGDRVHYQMVENRLKRKHPINDMEFKITSLLVSPYLAEGYAIIGLKLLGRS